MTGAMSLGSLRLGQPTGMTRKKTTTGEVLMIARIIRHLLGALLLACSPAGTLAQDAYPSRTIKIIVPIPPGTPPDILPRIVAERLATRWRQPVIVENRPGGALNIGAEAVAKAPPDGYTLLVTPPPPLAINQALFRKLAYDPHAFVPVTVMATMTNVLVANPKVPFATVQGLVEYAKGNPRRLSYASSGAGSTPHLAMELLKAKAGIELVHVPYKGLLPADLLAGHVDLMFNNLGNTLPHIRSGALRLLAVASEQRLAALPDVPTLSETFPGFVSTTWIAMVAPPNLPPDIAAKLSDAIREVLQLPDVARDLQHLWLTPVASTPAATAAFIHEERRRWRGVIDRAGIAVE
jgi:tripartite-type tricarboxylate transporter receptor subunit TctC